ncbi:MAG: 16S rRNA (cytosine(1402)-N(4))-methyltransferase RsmH [Polyangiales bacterium]
MEPLRHETVLLDEVIRGLDLRPGAFAADVTTGLGGHAEAILRETSPDGALLALDRDPYALTRAGERLAAFGDRVRFHQGPFSELRDVLQGRRLDALVADLGVSSPQIDDPERGMSFRAEGPLDMRMGPDADDTAWSVVRELREAQLADVIYQFGEERASRPIARSIKRAIDEGAMETTKDLARAVYRVLGPPRFGKLDPATRTFQALRISVNDELGEVQRLLASLPEVLADDGRVAVISFHSLEDRLVKHAFRGDAALEPLTRKPVEPSEAELERNPRSRSARLRVARRRPRTEVP